VIVAAVKLWSLARSAVHERRSSYSLLHTVLLNQLQSRLLLLCAGVLISAIAHAGWATALGILLLCCGELMGRYLFFVSVVPTNMATDYLSVEAA